MVFADEPRGDVDPETGAEMVACLIHRVKQQKATLIVVTHGTFPTHVADRVFTLANGQLTERSLSPQ